MSALAGCLALGCFHPAALHAQLVLAKPGETPSTFEVATIKPNKAGPGRASFMISAGMLTIENVPLRRIIMNAWGAKSNAQLTGGPDGILDQPWDIDAKIDPADVARMKNLPREETDRTIDLMLQSLLAERFHLKVHIDTQQLPVYELVVAKGGPKLTASAPRPPPPADGQAAPIPATGDKKPDPGFRGMRMTANGSVLEMTARNAPVEMLASVLARRPEMGSRLVLDKTGLAGEYDFTLHFAAEDPSESGHGGEPADTAADSPGLFTALEEQLGLKLEAGKAPVQIVVIDDVEPPTPN